MTGRWTPAEFARFAIAILGSTTGWQSRIARRLGVAPRTVRRWASGATAVPAHVQSEMEELIRLTAGERMGFPCRDEWILGDAPPMSPGASPREYIVHAVSPRFIARVVALDELTGYPEPDEDPVDTAAGVTYAAGPETLLCEIEWIDPTPDGPHLTQILDAASDAVESLSGNTIHQPFTEQ